jgi:hypothetical protein
MKTTRNTIIMADRFDARAAGGTGATAKLDGADEVSCIILLPKSQWFKQHIMDGRSEARARGFRHPPADALATTDGDT